MSTNDDPASRRGRRAGQGEPDWSAHNRRPGDRWDQPSSGNRDNAGSQSGRDNQAANTAYSGFTRPSYPQQRPEQAPPSRPYDQPQSQHDYYQEPVQRQEPPRSYNEPVLPAYSPPPPPQQPSYRHEPQLPSYGDTGRDDLFGRDSGALNYDQNPFGSQSGYQPASYDPAPPPRSPAAQPAPQDYFRQPQQSAEDYDRGFGGRAAPQESPSPRFFIPEEQQPAPQQWAPQSYNPAPHNPAPQQPPMDWGYTPAQGHHPAGNYDPQPQNFGNSQFDPRYGGQEAWHAEEQGYQEGAAGVPALHADEFDEDFFGDEEEDFDDDRHGGKRGRKMLILAAVAAAAVAGGGFYAYKAMVGGERATPFIRADNRPSKETPGNPGGRQFPNGEKAIYERLTPDGQTQMASFSPPPMPRMQDQPTQVNAPANGNSLDDRIEEALRRAQHSGDAPPAAPASRPGTDQPTVVRSEIYRPDGTRVDSRPVIQPQFSNVNQGQLPPPFGNGPPLQSTTPPQAASMSAPPPRISAPAQQQTPIAMAAATPPRPAPAAGGFYVSLKSAPDEKAIQRDLTVLTDKYKSVLGDVQIISKIADLGSRGVTYRAVAGPLGSRQEAMELCQKIKGVGGDKACFVTN